MQNLMNELNKPVTVLDIFQAFVLLVVLYMYLTAKAVML